MHTSIVNARLDARSPSYRQTHTVPRVGIPTERLKELRRARGWSVPDVHDAHDPHQHVHARVLLPYAR